ncbi:MAG: hypothetical protein ABIF40_03435 [archaeon]
MKKMKLTIKPPKIYIPSVEEIAMLDNYNYEFVPAEGFANTYALGVHKLRNECNSSNSHPKLTLSNGSSIYRPLTFKETIEARVKDYETLKDENGNVRSKEERLKLFQRYLLSCTGVAYKKETTKFKIIPVCADLIGIDKDFNQHFLPINYANLTGTELDSSQNKYNTLLTKQEVLNNPAWLTAVEDDKNLLKVYVNIVFSVKQENKLMRFWVRQNIEEDELRALFVDNLDYSFLC